MKFNIGLNGVYLKKEIPESYDGVTFRNWVEITKLITCPSNEVSGRLISIFSGVDHEIVKTAHIKNYEVILSHLSFLQKPPDQLMPSTIMGLPVPKALEDEAAGRYGDLQAITQKFVKDDNIGNLSYYPLIVATYVTKSPYNFKEAEILSEQLWEAPCGEVMAIGNFTLLRLHASKEGMMNSSHLEGTLRNRFRRAMINWLTRLAFSIRYGTWKRSLPSSVRKSLNGR